MCFCIVSTERDDKSQGDSLSWEAGKEQHRLWLIGDSKINMFQLQTEIQSLLVYILSSEIGEY